jgi:uncharacterized membrane protein
MRRDNHRHGRFAMSAWIAAGPSVLASFVASLVEFIEALTIVLEVGIVRGWRSALLGTGAGIVVLAALVLALGTSLAAVRCSCCSSRSACCC